MHFFSLVLLSLLLLPLSEVNTPHVDTALKYKNVKEKTGHNDGPEVEMFLKSVNGHKGDSWCSAFVSYCMTVTHVKNPSFRTALAQGYITKQSIKANDVLIGKVKIKRGDLVIYKRGQTIFGHIGISTGDWSNRCGPTIEGNTSGNAGSQYDGEGVYEKVRYIQPASAFRIVYFTRVSY